MYRNFHAILFFIFVFLVSKLALARSHNPQPQTRKAYVSLALAKQKVHTGEQVTAFGMKMIPYDREDLAMRFSAGYLLRKYIAFETGFTSVSGYGYQVLPNNDSTHYGFYSLDLMAKLLASYKRLSVFAAGGGALIYTNIENFFAFNPQGEELDTYGQYRPAYWPDHLFLRPRVSAGVSLKLNARFSLAVVYAYTFGCGKFSSKIGTVDSTQSMFLNPHFFPSFSTLGGAVIIRI